MTGILATTFCLFFIFTVKQFVGDFLLQWGYMLKKTRTGWGFVAPLAVHCVIHAALTAVIVLFYTPQLWWLILFDFVVHFVMDRIKSGPRYLGRINDYNTHIYWIIFGLDQMVHHLTHFAIIYFMVQALS